MKQDMYDSEHIWSLCHGGCPWEIREYFRYVANLGFTEDPDYDYLKSLFLDLFERSGFINV